MKNFFFFLKKLKKNYKIGYNSKIYKESSIENLTDNPAKIKIGNNCSIRGKLLVFAHGGEILIGNNVFIGENTQIWSASKIIIEDNVMISHGVNIIDTNSHPKNANLRSQHHLEIITKGHPIQGQIVSQIESFPIIIKKNSWISFNVTILKNVSIGENSIVGANTVINKNIKDNTIVFSEIKNIEKKIDNK
jgi:acetyltransferase-like isoleucine patch superfamily enzyme